MAVIFAIRLQCRGQWLDRNDKERLQRLDFLAVRSAASAEIIAPNPQHDGSTNEQQRKETVIKQRFQMHALDLA